MAETKDADRVDRVIALLREDVKLTRSWSSPARQSAVRTLMDELDRLRARQREEGDPLVPGLCPHCSGLMGHYGNCPHAPQLEGEREPETSQFLRDTLPRNWNYRIHVRGVGGVTVRAWDYEVPETEEYVAEVTQVDPRETRDNRDLLAQIRLGLERIATKRALDTEPPADDD